MISYLTKAFTLLLIPWLIWKLLGRFFGKSPLDVLPGPPSASLLFGNAFSVSESFANLRVDYDIGNIPKLYHSEGWDFHREIFRKCLSLFAGDILRLIQMADGTTMQIKGALGVSDSSVIGESQISNIVLSRNDCCWLWTQKRFTIFLSRYVRQSSLSATLNEKNAGSMGLWMFRCADGVSPA